MLVLLKGHWFTLLFVLIHKGLELATGKSFVKKLVIVEYLFEEVDHDLAV
jgi:hypothetical protein